MLLYLLSFVFNASRFLICVRVSGLTVWPNMFVIKTVARRGDLVCDRCSTSASVLPSHSSSSSVSLISISTRTATQIHTESVHLKIYMLIWLSFQVASSLLSLVWSSKSERWEEERIEEGERKMAKLSEGEIGVEFSLCKKRWGLDGLGFHCPQPAAK